MDSNRETIVALETQLLKMATQLTSQNTPNCAPIGARVDLERRFGAKYQELVRLGARPQIRKKYRPK